MRHRLASTAAILLALGLGTSACAATGDAVSASEPTLHGASGFSDGRAKIDAGNGAARPCSDIAAVPGDSESRALEALP